MKVKNTIALSSILSLVAAGSAFAAASTATTFTDGGTVTAGSPTVTIKPSKNVQVVYLSGAALTGTNGNASYSISSFHGSGTKLYASSSGDTKIFMKDATAIANPPTAPAVGSTMDATGYTAM